MILTLWVELHPERRVHTAHAGVSDLILGRSIPVSRAKCHNVGPHTPYERAAALILGKSQPVSRARLSLSCALRDRTRQLARNPQLAR